MSDPEDKSPQTQEKASADTRLLGPRKRIVAREVHSASLTDLEPSELAELGAEIHTPPPMLRVQPEPLVLDPTARIGERTRKHSHQRGYRFTAVAALLAFILASASIALILMDHRNMARLVAVASVLLAVAALRLAQTSKLASRLRGYAIAASVLAAVALAANLAGNFIHDTITETKRGAFRSPR